MADWQIRVDLRQRMEFPPEIAVTSKRPDIVTWSVYCNSAGYSVGTDDAMGSQNWRRVRDEQKPEE